MLKLGPIICASDETFSTFWASGMHWTALTMILTIWAASSARSPSRGGQAGLVDSKCFCDVNKQMEIVMECVCSVGLDDPLQPPLPSLPTSNSIACLLYMLLPRPKASGLLSFQMMEDWVTVCLFWRFPSGDATAGCVSNQHDLYVSVFMRDTTFQFIWTCNCTEDLRGNEAFCRETFPRYKVLYKIIFPSIHLLYRLCCSGSQGAGTSPSWLGAKGQTTL